MSDAPSFQELIGRARTGDADAAAELVRTYEPTIRRAVRFRLAGAALGGLLDSMDICQSVLASFFLRLTSGQYELDNPEQLVKLLATIARSKLAFQQRKQQAQRRDVRRVTTTTDEGQFVDPGASPSQHAANRDLLHAVRLRLSEEERRLVELRSEGHDWAEIARQLGGSAEALRKKLTRALDRVSRELGVDES